MANDNNIDLKSAVVAQGVSNDELKKLLEENLKLLKETHEMTHKIKSYINFQKFMSFVYLALIIGPIILSIMYLPPMLKQIFSQYNELMGSANPSTMFQGIDLKSLQGQNK